MQFGKSLFPENSYHSLWLFCIFIMTKTYGNSFKWHFNNIKQLFMAFQKLHNYTDTSDKANMTILDYDTTT